MAGSLNNTATVAYRGVVERFSDQIFEGLFWGMPTVNEIANRGGVKGVDIDTMMRMNPNLVKGYSSTFNLSETHLVKPIEYPTVRVKGEFQVDPGELENDYLGMLRRTGQDPHDNPLQLMQIMNHVKQIGDETEVALWQGVEAVTVDDTTPLIQCFDGFGQKLADAVTATDLTAYASGALTSANIIGHLRAMYDALHPALKRGGAKAYLSIDDMQNYLIGRSAYAQYTTSDFKTVKFDTGNMEIVFLPGIPKNKVVITWSENLVRNYDGDGDMSTFRIDDSDLYVVKFGLVYRIGVTIRFLEDEYVVVNDQW